jgi:twinkle protein
MDHTINQISTNLRLCYTNEVKSAKDLKMDGVFDVDSSEDELWSMYKHGLPKGSTTHFPSIDEYFTWREGEVTALTGYNNEGKSAILNNMCIAKAAISEWPCAFFSPENFPAHEFFEDCIHTYIGKTSDISYGMRMTPEEFKKGMDFLRSKFFLVHPEKEKTLDNLFERFDFLVRKHGVKIVVFDPLNQIEHLFNVGETMDMYISRIFSRFKQFAVSRRISLVIVAHQNPPKQKLPNGNYPEPDLYTIKNGGTISDKVDNVIAYWRPLRRTNESDPIAKFITQKIKKKKLTGKIGECEIAFQWQSNRFLDEKLQGKSPLDVPLSFVEDVQYQSQDSSTGNLFDLE